MLQLRLNLILSKKKQTSRRSKLQLRTSFQSQILNITLLASRTFSNILQPNSLSDSSSTEETDAAQLSKFLFQSCLLSLVSPYRRCNSSSPSRIELSYQTYSLFHRGFLLTKTYQCNPLSLQTIYSLVIFYLVCPMPLEDSILRIKHTLKSISRTLVRSIFQTTSIKLENSLMMMYLLTKLMEVSSLIGSVLSSFLKQTTNQSNLKQQFHST